MSRLSKGEKEIMEVFWEQQKPLAKSDIIRYSKNRSWKSSSIHVLLNSLLKKEAIYEAGYAKTATNIARTFLPSFSKEEYVVRQIEKSSDSNTDMSMIIASLIETTQDKEMLDEIEKIIRSKRKELK